MEELVQQALGGGEAGRAAEAALVATDPQRWPARLAALRGEVEAVRAAVGAAAGWEAGVVAARLARSLDGQGRREEANRWLHEVLARTGIVVVPVGLYVLETRFGVLVHKAVRALGTVDRADLEVVTAQERAELAEELVWRARSYAPRDAATGAGALEVAAGWIGEDPVAAGAVMLEAAQLHVGTGAVAAALAAAGRAVEVPGPVGRRARAVRTLVLGGGGQTEEARAEWDRWPARTRADLLAKLWTGAALAGLTGADDLEEPHTRAIEAIAEAFQREPGAVEQAELDVDAVLVRGAELVVVLGAAGGPLDRACAELARVAVEAGRRGRVLAAVAVRHGDVESVERCWGGVGNVEAACDRAEVRVVAGRETEKVAELLEEAAAGGRTHRHFRRIAEVALAQGGGAGSAVAAGAAFKAWEGAGDEEQRRAAAWLLAAAGTRSAAELGAVLEAAGQMETEEAFELIKTAARNGAAERGYGGALCGAFEAVAARAATALRAEALVRAAAAVRELDPGRARELLLAGVSADASRATEVSAELGL